MKLSAEKFELELLENNIVKMTIKDGVYLEVEDIITIHKEKKKLVGENKHMVLVMSGKETEVSKEGREEAAKDYITETRIAMAMVVNSLHQKIIGNFFIKVNKPKGHTKLFTCANEALNWLKQLSEEIKLNDIKNQNT